MHRMDFAKALATTAVPALHWCSALRFDALLKDAGATLQLRLQQLQATVALLLMWDTNGVQARRVQLADVAAAAVQLTKHLNAAVMHGLAHFPREEVSTASRGKAAASRPASKDRCWAITGIAAALATLLGCLPGVLSAGQQTRRGTGTFELCCGSWPASHSGCTAHHRSGWATGECRWCACHGSCNMHSYQTAPGSLKQMTCSMPPRTRSKASAPRG